MNKNVCLLCIEEEGLPWHYFVEHCVAVCSTASTVFYGCSALHFVTSLESQLNDHNILSCHDHANN